jgi:hypothetical protein
VKEYVEEAKEVLHSIEITNTPASRDRQTVQLLQKIILLLAELCEIEDRR